MMATSTEPDSQHRAERRGLLVSLVAGLGLATFGIVVGVLIDSQIILFNGYFTLLGVGLTWMALRVSRVVVAGPTARYPFGREALTPISIGFGGVALLATCVYAGIDAVLTIVAGGSDPPGAASVVYAVLTLVCAGGLAWYLRRSASASELARAEATQWRASGLLSVGMLVAFVVALVIEGSRWAHAARYIDPTLVIIACLAMAATPAQMIRATFTELIEGLPEEELQRPVREVVDEVRSHYDLGDMHLRMSKLGPKLYVEIDFVVAPDWSVIRSDEVRHRLRAALEELPQDVWITVEFTTDPDWGE